MVAMHCLSNASTKYCLPSYKKIPTRASAAFGVSKGIQLEFCCASVKPCASESEQKYDEKMMDSRRTKW